MPAVGELDVPRGLDHFCFCYWPQPEGPMRLRGKAVESNPTEGSPLLNASLPGVGCATNNFLDLRNTLLFSGETR